jgi:Na+/proline symporter
MNKIDNPLLNMKVDASSADTEVMNGNEAAVTEEQERKKMRRAALIKMLAMFIFIVCVIVFSSIDSHTF